MASVSRTVGFRRLRAVADATKDGACRFRSLSCGLYRYFPCDLSHCGITGLAGPFGPWLSNTAIARPSQELGRVVRYETSYALRVSEVSWYTLCSV